MINLRVEHVDLVSEQIIFTEVNAKGVTKGGRPRTVPVPSELFIIVKGLIEAKLEKEAILGLKNESTLRDGLSRACKISGVQSQGFHGFRHTYARNRLDVLLKEEVMKLRGKTMLERIFNNISSNRKADYGILSKVDKETFLILKKCIDNVHKDLGHGKDRWDLAKIYMK